MKAFYDLHLHSCLSPCGDADMTPGNIAGMAALKGLHIVALTDHNSCRNCPAFLAACEKNGLVGIAGMELTTAEEIHVVCLFEQLADAIRFSDEVDTHRFKIKNKPDIFGEQLILDENDELVGEEEHLLINATDLALEAATALVRQHGGFALPAHIDKQSNGIIGILGAFPETPTYTFVELADLSKKEELLAEQPALADASFLCDSDAHYLWDIHEAEYALTLSPDGTDAEAIRHALFVLLQGKEKNS